MSTTIEGATAQVAGAIEGKASMAQLQSTVETVNEQLVQIDTVKGTLTSANLGDVDVSVSSTDSDYAHKEYYDHITLYAKLNDVSEMRKIAHNFAIENLWMQCESGQQSKMEQSREKICSGDSYTYTNTSTNTTEELTASEVETLFLELIRKDIQAQHEVNMALLNIDYIARQEYLRQQHTLIQSMVSQQQTLIQSLNDWSQYMNQRANEYSQLYEKMNVIVNTTKRKDVFEVKDLRSLDGWNRVATNTFWVLMVVLLVMVVVQYQSELTSMATLAKQSITDVKPSASENDVVEE